MMFQINSFLLLLQLLSYFLSLSRERHEFRENVFDKNLFFLSTVFIFYTKKDSAKFKFTPVDTVKVEGPLLLPHFNHRRISIVK